MKVISRYRGEGKTTDAAKLCIETGAYLVVHSREEARRVSREFPELRFPLTFEEFYSERTKGLSVSVVIDNADMFIEYVVAHLGRIKVDAISVTLGQVK